MAQRLTKKEKQWADTFLETDNGTQSALRAYDTTDPNTAAVIAHENIRKPKIREYLDQQAEGAASRIVQLSMEAENETVRLNANRDILDRAGYKPVEKSVNLNINTDTKDIANPKAAEATEEYHRKLRQAYEKGESQ
jgi:phage terminase small subunit